MLESYFKEEFDAPLVRVLLEKLLLIACRSFVGPVPTF